MYPVGQVWYYVTGFSAQALDRLSAGFSSGDMVLSKLISVVCSFHLLVIIGLASPFLCCLPELLPAPRRE